MKMFNNARVRVATAALLLLASPCLWAQAQPGNAIESIIRSGQAVLPPRSQISGVRDALLRFYENDGYAAVWFEHEAPLKAAFDAVALLAEVPTDGLNPVDYKAAWLQQQLASAADARASPQEHAKFDIALTAAMLRFLTDLHYGRVDPRDIGWRLDVGPRKIYDAAAVLRAAIGHDGIAAAVGAAQPQLPIYARLKAALADYRRLASDMSLQPIPSDTTVKPGQSYPGAAVLAHLLTAVGDLTTAPGANDDHYGSALVDAVKRFQERHGLTIDGVIGKATFAELNRPLSQRVLAIEVALERLRWLPDLAPGPVIAVNVPSFKLWAFSDPRQSAANLEMNVVVGRAVNTRTPIFMQDMQYVQFSPYWNVPPSILRKEIIPKLKRDPDYLERQNMEFVARDGSVTTEVSDATLAQARAGELRLRQRPGPDNALGGIKFVLPNAMNIYLHGTPAQSLFQRPRRDFSHGCIRVADPVGLAHFVLGNDASWSRARIEALIESGESQAVRLPRPIPVIIFYSTAVVDHTGRVLFPPDIYHYDAKLEAALAASSGPRR